MDKRLRNLRKRSKGATIGLIVVSIVILFLLSYYAGNGWHIGSDYIINTSEEIRVVIDSPGDQEVFYDGDNIEVTGSVWGAVGEQVLVWDDRYNIPLEASIAASRYGIELYADDLSVGYHTLCVQAMSTEGKWTAVRTVTIEKKGTPLWHYESWSENNLPGPLGVIFRPVEEILKGCIVLVSGGTDPMDLNGDNIDDRLQQSPVPPRYNPLNLPMSGLIIFTLIILVVLVLIFYVVRPYIKYKQRREKEIRRSPEQRTWVMDIEALKNKELRAKLKGEQRRRNALENKYKREQERRVEASARRPVNIYLAEDQIKSKGKGRNKK